MFKSTVQALLKKIVETQIQSALLNHQDPQKTEIKRWLAIAHRGHFVVNCWNYQFSDGESLASFGLKSSYQFKDRSRDFKPNWYQGLFWNKETYRSHYLHKSQSDYRLVLEAWVLTKNKEVDLKEDLEFRWTHRFLGWLINLVDVRWEFDSKAFEDQALFSELKKQEEIALESPIREVPNYPTTLENATPSLREKYSVKELLDSPTILFRRMPKPAVKSESTEALEEKEEEKHEAEDPVLLPGMIPFHMQIWQRTLSLNHLIDQAHQREQAQAQNQAQEQKLDLRSLQEAQLWVDNSHINEKSLALDRLQTLGYKASMDWLDKLDRACCGESSWEQERKAAEGIPSKLKISETALDMLIAGKGHVRAPHRGVDLDTLPLGFFIDKEAGTYLLKYQEGYRQHQLLEDKEAPVRIDVRQQTSPFHLAADPQPCTVTKADLLQTLTEQGIELNQGQLDFLEILDKDETTVRVRLRDDNAPKSKIASFAFQALQQMATVKPQDNYVSELIDILEKFSHMGLNWGSVAGGTGFLRNFIFNYLKDLTDPREFYSREQREALLRVTHFTVKEFDWFYRIQWHVDCRPSFAETCRGLFYFFDYFIALGTTIPVYSHEEGLSCGLGGFIYLKDRLDTISLSGGGQDITAQRFQAQYTSAIPNNSALVKTLLRSGYSFVHTSMLIDSWYFESEEIPNTTVSPQQFRKIAYLDHKPLLGERSYDTWIKEMPAQSYCRAMYLRYLACCVDPNYFHQAIRKWEETTKTPLHCGHNDVERFDRLDLSLSAHWEELKAYALSLPTKMDACLEEKEEEEKSCEAAYTPEAFVNQRQPQLAQAKHQYCLAQASAFLEQLDLPGDLGKQLLTSIKKLNELALNYADLSQEELRKAALSIRDSSPKPSLEEQIALLREMHRRLTRTKVPGGEWLRLEQLTAILLNMEKNSLLQVDTGEGKTLIIQLLAILKVFQGACVDVLTHNESLASEAGDKIKQLSDYFNIKAAKMGDPDYEQADILYVDAATTLINDLLTQLSHDPNPLAKRRQASFAIVDEVDNVIIDINATTTMQVSQGTGEADQDLEVFLMQLNAAVRLELVQHPELQSKESQGEWIRSYLNERLENNTFYQALLEQKEGLDKYIRAAVSAMQLVEKIDYRIENEKSPTLNVAPLDLRKVVRIVHKDTTGRVDKVSQWGAGVHQCLCAWEKQNHPEIIIPGNAQVLAEGDIGFYLQSHYTSRCGFTASLGKPAVRKKIEQALNTHLSLVLPRAVRKLDSKANWPLKVYPRKDGTIEVLPQYNRSYRFPPIYTDSEKEHSEKILEAIQDLQNKGLSCILFFNTIKECEEFCNYLRNQGISKKTIQILDDTYEEGNQVSFHPSETLAIASAKNPKMITLTTAAGSRGTDFDDIKVGLLAKPGLGRVTIQKAGRVGRNGQFAIVYEIYCNQDLKQSENPMEGTFRRQVLEHEEIREQNQLDILDLRQPERRARANLQTRYFQHRNNSHHAVDKQALDQQWAAFFSRIKPEEDLDLQWESFVARL